VATRVLASFVVMVLAFAVTVGWGIFAQRRAAEDNLELARGYVPVALKLGQLRATQAALSSLVDGIADERDPVSTRTVLEPLAAARRAKFQETRAAIEQGLTAVGSPDTQRLAVALARGLDLVESDLEGDHAVFERVFSALAAQDRDTANREIVLLGALEHDAEKRLHTLSDTVSTSIDSLSDAAREREQRSIYALFVLAALTIAVGVGVSLHTRRLLTPLARVTERAQAVARGDLTPRPIVASSDEIGQLAAAFERMVAAVARAQALALSNERLAAIGKMAAHVTHEIRNPLSSIGLNLEMLEEEIEGASADERRALVSAIKREVERLEHLSEEYLRVARLPSPRMEADDVAAAVREIVAFARPEIERAGCTAELHVADAVPPALFDESQLRQALLNLLRNAREAMPKGGAIDVRIEGEGMSVVIRVDDRGGGIPEEIRARVFDPFFSTKGEGTGLGLAITRHIVEAHGGTITCDARDGGGTSFRVALPIAPARASAPLAPASRGEFV
jgi:signal transduction histidine kinase